jgi:predicted CopG family antitoxin
VNSVKQNGVEKRRELTEKVMVSADIKQVLYSNKLPGERLGDVVSRLIRDRKRDEFIEHLDRIARQGDFVPLDSDPEFAKIKKEVTREGQHRPKRAPVH